MLKDKLKALKKYKIYDYEIFIDVLEKKRAESKISKASKKGLLVKIGKGKFYISNNKEERQRRFKNNPIDRSALRYNCIVPSKYEIFKKLFWSNQNKSINLDQYISRVLSEDLPMYIPYLSRFFGDRKVVEVYLNNFFNQSNRLPHIESYMEI